MNAERCYLGHTHCKRGADLQVGDILNGRRRSSRIASIEPYEWYNDRFPGFTASIATDVAGEIYTIEHHICMEVA